MLLMLTPTVSEPLVSVYLLNSAQQKSFLCCLGDGLALVGYPGSPEDVESLGQLCIREA